MSHIKNPTCPPWRAAGIVALMACVFIGGPGWANNITVSNVKRFGQTPGSHWMVLFNISWTNSWRSDLAGAGQAEPFNYDAAWVFIKWRTNDPSAGITGNWYHASLSTNASDHVLPSGGTIEVGRDGRKDAWGTNGVGVFIYRSANGSGTFTANKTQLRWNHAADGVADSAPVELKVCAIEMVYVPTEAFYAGSVTNGTEPGRLCEGGGLSNAYLINSELAITCSNLAGCLWGASQSGNTSMGGTGSIPDAFPKGYSAFYGMKYEITQAQYADFLNMLTRNQQTNRFTSTGEGYFMHNTTNQQTSPASRNGVELFLTNSAQNPRVYVNNLDTNNAPNSTNDGQWIACNWMSPADLAAYLDWAGLRPMTELEFEKACRGTNTPVQNEYPGGTAAVLATNLINEGTANERILPTNANYITTTGAGWPVRVGCFGVGIGTRSAAGAGYYGIMELSGNIMERPVSVASGRTFTGLHGNGVLNSAGNADVALWPQLAWRGGSVGANALPVANRTYAAISSYDRLYHGGGRGVRTAP